MNNDDYDNWYRNNSKSVDLTRNCPFLNWTFAYSNSMINGWERYSAISKLIGRREFYIPPCAIAYQRSADYRENCWNQPKQSGVLSCNIHENLTWTTIQEIRPKHIALCCNMLIISCLDHDYCLNLCTNHKVHFLTHLIKRQAICMTSLQWLD